MFSGSPSSTKLSSCPTFMKAPFMFPRVAATSSALRSWKAVSSSSRRADGAAIRRTPCTAARADVRPPSPPIVAHRRSSVRTRGARLSPAAAVASTPAATNHLPLGVIQIPCGPLSSWMSFVVLSVSGLSTEMRFSDARET